MKELKNIPDEMFPFEKRINNFNVKTIIAAFDWYHRKSDDISDIYLLEFPCYYDLDQLKVWHFF